jgi:RimJ/RimL family protein N-acetyltransferase
MQQELITTERLILRQMTEGDIDAFLLIFSDPEAMKYFNVVFDRPRMEQWVKSNLEHQTERRSHRRLWP